MMPKLQITGVRAAVAAAGLVWSVCGSWAQDRGGSVELEEAGVAVRALQAKVEELTASLSKSEAQVKALGQGMAAANAESEQFRESYAKLRLQLEALGVSVLDRGDNGLEQRLLQAVNDRRLLEEENARLSEEVFNLSEVLLAYMDASVGAEPEALESAKKALDRAESVLATRGGDEGASGLAGSGSGSTIQDGRVISVKADYGLIVLNMGKVQGVRLGMPVRVVRKDRPIGTVMVVDVRDRICGAVVQNLASEEPFAVGDIARVAAE